jgi:single-strand DNA-binding protein
MENLVILIGNVGKEPEIRITEKSKIVKFTLATSERYKDKDGEYKDKTQWHNIVMFLKKENDAVEKYIKKGIKLYLTGKIDYQSWEHEGKKIYQTAIVANNWKTLSKLADGSDAVEVPVEIVGSDDLPF